MHIYTKLVLDFSGNVVEQRGYEYYGPVSECKGATTEQKDQAASQAALAKQQAAFYQVMTASYNKMFAGQTAILDAMKQTFEPILKSGPNQYGFSRAEDVAMRTMASEGTAGNYRMAKQAVGESQAAAMGDEFIPRGSTAQVNAQLASQAAAQESEQQLGITKAGYEVGRQNFGAAANALGGVAGMMSPTGYSGAATGAGSSAASTGGNAFDMYSTIYKENRADSPWNIVGGVLGGALGAGVNAFTGGLGGMAAKALGGGKTAAALPSPVGDLYGSS